MSEATWTIYPDGDRGHRTTANGDRFDASRHATETLEQFEYRLSWGRMDELIVDWIGYLTGDGDPDAARAPAGTINTYRSDCNCYLIPGLGDLWLTDASYDEYEAWGNGILKDKNLDRFKAAARTLDSLITWAFDKKRWPIDVAPFGGKEARNAYRNTKKRTTKKTRRTLNGRTRRKPGKVSLFDCPTIERTVEFGQHLGQAAADLWGEQARCLGDLPISLTATGSRIATGYALHADDFSLETLTAHLVDQIDRSRPFELPTGDLSDWEPPLQLIKQKDEDGYTVGLWPEMVPILEPILERARDTDGWLFAAAQPKNVWALNAFEALYRTLRTGEYDYPWSSQWHRHAYASWSLAPVDLGGEGWDIATVAACLGDNIDIVQKTYLHASSNPTGHPGPRRRRR